MHARQADPEWEIIIVGAGLAGLSAAIYLGRARRRVLLIHHGRSMARWEPLVENYLGFPEGLSGRDLLERGYRQAARWGVNIIRDEVLHACNRDEDFCVASHSTEYKSRKLLIATGGRHLPPEIPGFEPCIGKSILFCKDCDGTRFLDKRIAVVGNRNEAAEFALGMLRYSRDVAILTHGARIEWSGIHAGKIKEQSIPVHSSRILCARHQNGALNSVLLEDDGELPRDALFAALGDTFHHELAEDLGAELDRFGQILVNSSMQTSVPGLYAAGCVTPANCQMIIAAGNGAIAAQSINRELFEEEFDLRPCQVQSQAS